MNLDWKDALKSLQDSGSLPEGEEPETDIAETKAKKAADRLHIVIEKKGRHGKTATIIEGFSCSDDELQQIAQTLKKKIGTGGSARGGEILLQGEFRDKAAETLRSLGYRI